MRIMGTSLEPLEVWRGDTSWSEARGFGSSLLASLLRVGAGSYAARIGARPRDRLILYEMEACPFSRLVREALSELDLDALIKPCPPGEHVHRAELRALSGKEQIPFLVDPGHQVRMSDSEKIVRYLYEHYGSGPPPRHLAGGPVVRRSSKLASKLRGGEPHYREPKQKPARTLELFGYEGSPYTRLVRERLSELGLSYVSHNLARHSPRRAEFLSEFGKLQFPRLFDPNTGVGMFESEQILRYLEDTYGQASEPQEATPELATARERDQGATRSARKRVGVVPVQRRKAR